MLEIEHGDRVMLMYIIPDPAQRVVECISAEGKVP
jgi:hypothetical protein